MNKKLNTSEMTQSLIAQVTGSAPNVGSLVQGRVPRMLSDLEVNGLMESVSTRFEAVMADAGMSVTRKTELQMPQTQFSARSAFMSVQGQEPEQTPRGQGHERKANADITQGGELPGRDSIGQTAKDDSSRPLPDSKSRLDPRETAPESMADHVVVCVNMPKGSLATMALTVTKGSNQESATLEQSMSDCGEARQTRSVQASEAPALFTENSSSWSTTVRGVPEAMFSNLVGPTSIVTTLGLDSPALSTETPGEQPREVLAKANGPLARGSVEGSELPVGILKPQPTQTGLDQLLHPLSGSQAYGATTQPALVLRGAQPLLPFSPSFVSEQAPGFTARWTPVQPTAPIEAFSDPFAPSGTVPVLEASAGEALTVVPISMSPTDEAVWTISPKGEGSRQSEIAIPTSPELHGVDQRKASSGTGVEGRVGYLEPKYSVDALGTQSAELVQFVDEAVSSNEAVGLREDATQTKSAQASQSQTELNPKERIAGQASPLESRILDARQDAGAAKPAVASLGRSEGSTQYSEQVVRKPVVEYVENAVRPQQKATHPAVGDTGPVRTDVSHAESAVDSVGKIAGPVKSAVEPTQSSSHPAEESTAVEQERLVPYRYENARTRQIHEVYEVLSRSGSDGGARPKPTLSEGTDSSSSRRQVASLLEDADSALPGIRTPSQMESGRVRSVDDRTVRFRAFSGERSECVEQRVIPAGPESSEMKLERTRVDVGTRRVMAESRSSEPFRAVNVQETSGQVSAVEQRFHLEAEKSQPAEGAGEQVRPGSVVDQIVDRVSIEVSRTKPTITVGLKPERLGSVEVRVEVENGRILASIQAETDEARRVLRSSTSQLVSALKEQGLQVSEVRISSIHASQPDTGRDELRQQFAQGQQFGGGDASLQMDGNGDFGRQGHGRFQQTGTHATWDGYLQETPEDLADSPGAMVRSMGRSGQLEYRA